MQQPQPIVQKYSRIITNIDEGIYQIPRFQRDFVWDKKQSAKLIDSLLRGFPIGTFILWKTRDRLKSLKKLGGSVLNEVPQDDSVYYVLDGQQRITSLYLALKGEKTDRADYKEIYIDLDKDLDGDDKICTIEKSKNCVSFYDLMNESLLDLAKKFGDENARKIENLRKHIDTYDFSTIEITDQPLEKIADIFTRINTSGKSLTIFEIMCAKTYEESENSRGFDLEEKFKEFIEKLKNVGYESLGESEPLVLQLVALILKQNATKKAILSLQKDDFINAWDKSLKCLEKAIDEVARNHLKIPASKLLPYPTLLLSFAYFYHKNDLRQPTQEQLKMLGRYFYRNVFSERLSSASDTKITQDTDLIDKIQKNERVDFNEILPVNLNENDLIRRLCGEFSTGSAFAKGVLCILTRNTPLSFKNNNEIVVSNEFLSISTSQNYHHFFPKAFLKKQKNDKFANAIANITLIDDNLNKSISNKAPSKYISEFQAENNDLDKALKSHFIELDDFGILDDDFDMFLKKRSSLLASEIIKKI